MKWMQRRAVCGAAWLAAAMLCLAGGQSAARAALPGAENRVACRFGAGGKSPDFSVVETLRARMGDSAADGRAQGEVTAWAQASGVEAACKETGGSVSVEALWIDGPSRLIWDWRAAGGSLPDFGSARVCALDAGTALRLFGSLDVAGQRVEVGGARLTVACVFELPQGLTVWGADPGAGLVLCPVQALDDPPAVNALDFSVVSRDGQSAGEWASAWLSAAGIDSPASTDARAEQSQMLALATQAPSAALALLIACPLIAAAAALVRAAAKGCTAQWADRLAPVSRGWRTLGAGLAGAALLLALAALAAALPRIAIHVPPSYLPTRWSDLSFWPELAAGFGEQSARRAMLPALRPDMVRDHWIALSAGLSLAAAPLFWLAWRAFRQAARPDAPVSRLLWPAVAACSAALLAQLAVGALGWPPAGPPGLAALAVLLCVVPPLLLAYPPAELLRKYRIHSLH